MLTGLSLAALNHLLGQAAWARQRLAPHVGRRARIDMPPWAVEFRIGSDGLVYEPGEPGAPDVTFALPFDAPLRALRGQAEVFRDARVDGAADLADALNFVLLNLRWDAEEDLSRLVGDIAAHRLVGGARAFAGWQKGSAERLGANVSEYLREEQPLLVGRRQLDDLADGIREFERSLADLEGRVRKLS
ncbi:MAG TPA: hypothetical protein PKD29_02240 [Rhodocyclaceae bacterium]|nr:hypothetical protein [Rhodocyclaceae bacterium]